MRLKLALILALVILGSNGSAQERALLPPPPPPMRNPMLLPDKVPTLPSFSAPTPSGDLETPGWIMRRGNSGKWQILWQGRWVGKNQMMGDEKIINIDEYGVQVKGPSGKRDIPVVGVNLSRQQKEHR